ncbi:MAG: glycosyl transferase [Patescibacteria group bacterium]|nr:glycosyl transferase [Patescibacteria group bacterium]
MIKNSKIINENKITSADIAVGIPTLNEVDNIAFVVKKVDQGLNKYFKNRKAVIINVDNHSLDGTKEAFLNVKTKNAKIYISTSPGIRGKGNNFYNLFSYIQKLGSKAVAVVDADLKSITPEWPNILLKPILNGWDYITPYYARSEYDGTITNHICYPLIYGLFGYDIRQPIGGDFSFSGKLAASWLKHKWHKTTKQYGIDIFMTLNAIEGGFKIAQAGLGAKIHKPSAPKLGPMFSQVITTLFKNIIIDKKRCFTLAKTHEVPYFGKKQMEKPQTVSVDYKGMKATSIFNFHANEDILRRGLSSSVYKALKKMYDKEDLRINSNLWYKIIYDAVYAYDRTDLSAGLIEALKPLYFGRVISFFKLTLDKSFEICEQKINNQAEKFWKNRNYLIKKYK